MSRSQRHKILFSNYSSDCKIVAEHAISPGYHRQFPGPFVVPTGAAGGPLRGSSLAGPAPAAAPPGLREAIIDALEDVYGPVLTSLSPNTVELGSPNITMICTGTGFTEETIIHFSDQDEPTTFISETQVSTGITPTLGWGPVSLPVYVKNGQLQSDVLQFTFTEAPPPPEEDEEEVTTSKKRKGK